jgi:hypothetical protein
VRKEVHADVHLLQGLLVLEDLVNALDFVDNGFVQTRVEFLPLFA